MDFWDSTTVQLYVGMQHQERIAQGMTAQHLAALRGKGALRPRLILAILVCAAALAFGTMSATAAPDPGCVYADAMGVPGEGCNSAETDTTKTLPDLWNVLA